MNVGQWLKAAAAALSGGDSPKRDAEILLAFVTGRSRSFLLAFDETPLSEAQRQQLDALLAQRLAGQPIAYLTGEREFWSLSLCVSPATLIPRPDTEILVEQALACLPAQPARILDLGSGSGAVALALASERPDCQVTGVDCVPQAVALARHNACRLGIQNSHFLSSNWFSALKKQTFDVIVGNPPYIDAEDVHLQCGDVRFEPRSALVAGQKGVADLQHIIENSKDYLVAGGWLLLEHGWQQASRVRRMFRDHAYLDVSTRRDYGGNERVTQGRKAPE